ncbi:DUF4230 domain-containing protein [Clostridium tagluense]|uniref:DUF4230 domain-containing protein n=1 Tax=Clostridium tagluense TaxID=360422 RepID=UPI001C0E0B99|nr:DUF4230 domain-containing protein [Clostridium tagluense]MBU3129002.1 hypothetical protein [Clostridium tagluense]
MDEIGKICNECGNTKNKNGECQVCLARGELAATATASFKDTMFFPKRACKGKISRKIEAKILNKILIALMIVCAITVISCFYAYKYKENAASILVKALPQNQTSAYALGQYKSINELHVLKINKAEFYHYKDEKRDAELIIRYYVNASFDLNNCKVIQNSNDTVNIEIKKPVVTTNLNADTKYTEEKAPKDYPGVEILTASNSILIPGYDFKIGEIEDIAKSFIKTELDKKQIEYEKMAFDNLKVKLKPILEALGLKISSITLEGERE